MDAERILETTLPHSSFGKPDCCGFRNGIIRGDQADIVCNECEELIRTLSVADLQQTLDEMELTLDLSSAACPQCGAANLFPGFSKILAFTWKQCGKVAKLSDDPEIDRFFG